jgi:PAS domain S-box-containing protein
MAVSNQRFANWPKLLLFSVVYVFVGFIFVAVNRQWPIGQALWPYTGIGLAGVLLFGFRVLPFIALLNFSLSLSHYPLGIAAGQTLAELVELCISAWLLRRLRFNNTFQKLSNTVIFLLAGAAAGPFVGAGLKQLPFLLVQHRSWNEFFFNWWAWWRGDVLGILVFTPLLLSWMLPSSKQSFRPKGAEIAALLAGFGLVSFMILYAPVTVRNRNGSLVAVFFLFVFWAAMRLGVRAAITVACFAILVGSTSLIQSASSSTAVLSDALLRLWAFASALSTSALLMAAAIAERASAYDRNRQLAAILEATPDFVGIARPDGKILFLNSAAKSLLPNDTMLEEATISVFHPPEESRMVFEEVIPSALRNGTWSGESVFLRNGKEKIPVSQVVIAHKSEDGQVEFLSSIARDLSEQKRVEDALRAAATGVSEGIGQGFFQTLVQHLALALRVKYVFVGAIRQGSKDRVKTLAVCAEGTLQPNFEYELGGTPCENVFEHQLCYYSSAVTKQFPEDVLLQEMGVDAYMGVPLFASTGESLGLMVALHDRPFQHSGLAASILQIYSTRAATELERLRTEESLRISEQKLYQAQKMQALGNLAGGIAHDFNNVLTVIKGCSILALDNIAADSPTYEDIQEVQKAADRAAALTGHLLAFSRQQTISPRLIDINSAIFETTRMLGRILGEDVKIVLHLSPEAGCINADPGQFDQVVMNLAVNARDAMSQGGLLEFTTRKIAAGEPREPSVALGSGEYILLQISDTGIGMDEATIRRIFEPFYTTKPLGKGTGLGLATVYGIMERIGGHIGVSSKPGQGTAFNLYFPSAKAVSEMQAGVRPDSVSSGEETVLLVEDDSALRNLAHRILHSAGYTVLTASGVEGAERVLQEFSGDIALVITDVVMPDGGGDELVSRIARTKPSTKILFISGYTDGRVPQQYLTGEHPSFLAKPFEPAQLTKKVREILDSEQSFSEAHIS